MKIKLTFIIVLLFCTLTMNAQKDLFDKLSDNDEITVVYISKSMLNLAKNIGDKSIGDMDIKEIAGKLDQIEIYTTDKVKEASMMAKEAAALSKDKSYETMMRVKDKGENVVFYSKQEKNIIKELLMVTSKTGECTIIRIFGNFTAEDIKKITDR